MDKVHFVRFNVCVQKHLLRSSLVFSISVSIPSHVSHFENNSGLDYDYDNSNRRKAENMRSPLALFLFVCLFFFHFIFFHFVLTSSVLFLSWLFLYHIVSALDVCLIFKKLFIMTVPEFETHSPYVLSVLVIKFD